ncbi:MAG: 50S ribosomal protein L10 [Phycisphaerae bacterium]|nr:50S ribosomal protein L10 [Phycisphaerae bacterium]
MSRRVKESVEKELAKRYRDLESVMVVSVHGLSGTAVNEVRGELRKKDIEVHVVKNRAAKRVLAGTVLEPLGSFLEGPCAFVTGGPSPVDAAKELMRLTKDYPALELKFGLVEGEPEILSVDQVSKRKGRTELQGEIVMLAISPARRIAGCLNVGGKVAGCLKAIVEKLERGEEIQRVA